MKLLFPSRRILATTSLPGLPPPQENAKWKRCRHVLLNGVLVVAEPCRQLLERSGHGLLEDGKPPKGGKLPEGGEAGRC